MYSCISGISLSLLREAKISVLFPSLTFYPYFIATWWTQWSEKLRGWLVFSNMKTPPTVQLLFEITLCKMHTVLYVYILAIREGSKKRGAFSSKMSKTTRLFLKSCFFWSVPVWSGTPKTHFRIEKLCINQCFFSTFDWSKWWKLGIWRSFH